MTAALVGLGVALFAETVVWGVSLRRRDASIADPFWGPGFVLVALGFAVASGGPSARGTLALGLVSVWAARLAAHLGRRNLAEGEDRRYAAMRARHGDRFGRVSLITVFWLLGGLMWVFSAPLFGAIRSTEPLGWLDGVGVTVFVAGWLVETIADAQLARHRADPALRGTVLDRGLWRYSRHPNYFGEAVLWWGLWLVALSGGAAWTAVGPALLTFFLLRVSGVTLLERDLRDRKPEYAAYVRRTSAFVPWPPSGP